MVEMKKPGRTCLQTNPTWNWTAPSPMDGTPTSRSRWVLLQLSQAFGTQWTVWARRAEKKHLVSKSPGAAGPGSFFLGGAPLKYDSTLSISVTGGLGIVLGYMVREKKYPDMSPGVFFLAHSTGIYKPGAQVYLGRLLPK